MLAVKGIYDGKKVEILDKVNIPEGKLQEVIVTFLDEEIYLESFDLHEFINDWTSEEIGHVSNSRKNMFTLCMKGWKAEKGRKGGKVPFIPSLPPFPRVHRV